MITIGRTPENNVVINENRISERHFSLYKDNDGDWIVEDTGSKNGTYVNGVRVARKVVNLETDQIKAANIALDTTVLDNILKRNPIPKGLVYDKLKQEIAIEESFLKLEKVYDDYYVEFNKIDALTSTQSIIPIAAGAVPFVGAGLAAEYRARLNKTKADKKKQLLNKFSAEYVCPKCDRFFLYFETDHTFKKLRARNACPFCNVQFVYSS